jgi:hypothetical protein
LSPEIDGCWFEKMLCLQVVMIGTVIFTPIASRVAIHNRRHRD